MDNWADIWITSVGCKTESALSLAQGEFSHTVLTRGQKGDWDTRSTWGISTISCALALVKLRKPTATGTGFFGFTTRFPFQQSLCSSSRIGTWLVLDIHTSLSLTSSLLLFLVLFTQWQSSCGQDGGDSTYFLVLIKAQLWGLCIFNISSYQCFVIWCCCQWLSTNIESRWNFRGSRLIRRHIPGPLYLKGTILFLL